MRDTRLFLGILLLSASLAGGQESAEVPKKDSFHPLVVTSVRNDESPPLATLISAPVTPRKKEAMGPPRRLPKYIEASKSPSLSFEVDGALQSAFLAPLLIPTPSLTFDGINNACGCLPPDTNGDVGPNHYVQTVNSHYRVWNKSGSALLAVTPINTLWSGFGGACETRNDGDPVVLYDPLADRWLISQFTSAAPFHQCVAISTSPDPLGSYNRYAFLWPGGVFADYPHYGVWPDGYYISVNQFNGNTWAGAGSAVFERDKMLAGLPAQMVYFNLLSVNSCYGGMLPSDLDGPPPPSGAPNYFVEVDDNVFNCPSSGSPDSVKIWKFDVDWVTPSSSTFGINGNPNTQLTTAAFDAVIACGASGRDCIPQPGTTEKLDAIADRLMFRVSYRNLGTHEALVLNHTVDANGSNKAGVRWYELRDPNGSPTIFQQGTYSPDALHRWMGSAAMDNDGNIVVGFSRSGSGAGQFPSIFVAGRLAGDPAGQLSQGETAVVSGGGSQTHTASRWGDYSMLSVDPSDDCTFWYTNEYYASTSSANWLTKIGKVIFPSCTPTPTGTIQGTVTDSISALPISGATVQSSNGFSRLTSASGTYSMNVPAGTYNLTASAAGFQSANANGVAVTNGGTTVQNFSLNAAPNLLFSSAIFSGGNSNGNIDPNECLSLQVSLLNIGLAPATAIAASLSSSTPGVTVTQPASAFSDIAGSTIGTTQVPFGFSTSLSFVCGIPVQFTLQITTNQGTFAIPFTLSSGIAYQSADVPKSIPDSLPAGIDSINTIAGFAGSIGKATASVHATHTWDGDLDVSLIGPDNTNIDLSSDNGGNGDNYGTSCGNKTVFDDGAATAITAGAVPFSGTFRPEVALSALNGKSGVAVNGIWKLHVADDTAVDVGVIQCWTLTLSPSCVDGGGVCSTLPGEATPLNWSAGSTSSFQWGAASNATGYNLYRGIPADLPNLLNSSNDSCRRWSGTALTTGNVITENPAPGSFYWFLIRAISSAGNGSAGNATFGPRILNSTGTCP